MKRRFRLTRSTDFKRVRRLGKSYAHPLIILIALANKEGQTRIGVSAGRSVGNAVQRNRGKRLLKAAITPLISSIAPGYDIILLARRATRDAKSPQLQHSLKGLLEQANLIDKKYER